MASKKKEISREEIAKQFMLPERQSKIATLLKQDGQAYCICRSSDSSRFMIGCDACEEWYHGDCINITKKEAKCIKQFFCVRCREEDPTLVTRYKPKQRKDGPPSEERKRKKEVKFSSKRCGQCMGCYRTEDCGRCDACKDMKKYGGSNRLKLRCKHRTCINSLQGMGVSTKRRRKPSASEESGPPAPLAHLQTSEPRQCYGPQCVQSARWGSKYCSEACGLKLAANRIYQVLPQRIQEWALSPCEAEIRNRRGLEKVRAQQTEVRRVLEELDRRHRELDAIIERAKTATIDPKAEEELEDESEMSMYCITCGHEIHSRTAIKHMEKCFNKYEAQASFGSVFKTRIEGNVMFCDFYNPINRTYCKRLRVLCPEHCKEPKVSDNEVCGCPLVTNVFDLSGEFCRLPKKSCVKHYAWEKLRRAEVDMERVRQWLKIDELIEQERQLRHSMASRAGVLGLMLHSTYNHEVIEQITAAQDQEAVRKELARRFMKGVHGQ